MDNKNLNNPDRFLVREALNGLLLGIILMIIGFLFAHYVLGIEAFA